MNPQPRIGIGRLAAWIWIFVLAACGRSSDASTTPTYPVRGRVLLNDRPLAAALVVFHPIASRDGEAVRSYARTDRDGSFSVSTYRPNDGAPAGKYRVSILAADEDDGPRRIPVQYADPQHSGIEVEISEGENQLQPFHLRG